MFGTHFTVNGFKNFLIGCFYAFCSERRHVGDFLRRVCEDMTDNVGRKSCWKHLRTHCQASVKQRIICDHINGLDLCKANLQLLTLSTAEKYIPEIDLVYIVPGMAIFQQSLSSVKSVWICWCFQLQSIFALGQDLHRRTTKVPVRKEENHSYHSRAGAYIKPLLVRCALNAIRCKANL